MIAVKITRKDGQYRAVSSGHADYNPGNDIVCASVSTIMFTLMGAVENLTDAGLRHNSVEGGHIDIRCKPMSETDKYVAALLFNAAIIGVLQVQEKYPDCVQLIK